MTSLAKNKTLYLDIEAVVSLSLVKEGILSPVDGLMDEKTAYEVNQTGLYKGKSFPFSFILAPSGKRNAHVLASLSSGETVDLMNNGKKIGELYVNEVFSIDPLERIEKIYGTRDTSHPGVANTLARLGHYAVCGEYTLIFDEIREIKQQIQKTIKQLGAKSVTGMVLAARPLNRAHERMIRLALEKTDLVIIFLLKPYSKDDVPYAIRKESVEFIVENYMPKNRILIVPFDNTYLFAGINELILDAIALQNFGCQRFIVGKEHAGLGIYYEKKELHSIFDTLKGLTIAIEIVNHYVYCEVCSTLVSPETCPHGQHHHISYHSESILELLRSGLLPPPMLLRKEISAMYLTHFFPKRFNHLERLYYDLVPNLGLMEEHTEKDFYLALAKLYQTSSLT